MLKYTAREQFIPFHNRSQRWATLVTHRRAGKTIALVNDLIFAGRTPLVDPEGNPRPDPQYAYIGPTFTQAKRVAWRYLKNFSRPYWTAPPSESELRVTLGRNATIYALGADNADSLRGMYLDGAVCDEYALWKPSVFSQVLRPALSDRNGWGVFASTPRAKNLFYDQVKKAQADPLHHYLLTLRADQSGLVPEQELDDLRADMDPEEFAQEYLCSFDSALKGAIYADEVNQAFSEHRTSNALPLFDPALPTNVVFDLGFTDATVAIYWQEAHSQIRIVGVEATNGKSIHHHIGRIEQFSARATLGSVWLPHDARAKNLQTGMSIVEQFLSNQIRPNIVPNHKVRDRIAATRATFPRIYFDQTVLQMEDLVEALKSYRREWDEDNLCFKEQPLHDWASDYADSFGYLAMVAHQSQLSADPTARARLAPPPPTTYTLDHLFQDRDDSLRRQGRRIA